MLPGADPPTTSSGTSLGSTARCPFTTAGEAPSAGNSFSPVAPARSASNASEGVKKPGRETRPAAAVASMTGGKVLGETMTRPPTSRALATSSAVSTVPAPIKALSPKRRARRSMLAKGSGELSGTSMIRMPASKIASPIASTSSGVTPRMIATSGHR